MKKAFFFSPIVQQYVHLITEDRLSEDQRDLLTAKAIAFANGKTWVLQIFVLAITISAFFIPAKIAGMLQIQSPWDWLVIAVYFAFVVFTFRMMNRINAYFFRCKIAELLYAEDVRTLICAKCQYSLIGCHSDECPECGQALASIHPESDQS